MEKKSLFGGIHKKIKDPDADPGEVIDDVEFSKGLTAGDDLTIAYSIEHYNVLHHNLFDYPVEDLAKLKKYLAMIDKAHGKFFNALMELSAFTEFMLSFPSNYTPDMRCILNVYFVLFSKTLMNDEGRVTDLFVNEDFFRSLMEIADVGPVFDNVENIVLTENPYFREFVTQINLIQIIADSIPQSKASCMIFMDCLKSQHRNVCLQVATSFGFMNRLFNATSSNQQPSLLLDNLFTTALEKHTMPSAASIISFCHSKVGEMESYIQSANPFNQTKGTYIKIIVHYIRAKKRLAPAEKKAVIHLFNEFFREKTNTKLHLSVVRITKQLSLFYPSIFLRDFSELIIDAFQNPVELASFWGPLKKICAILESNLPHIKSVHGWQQFVSPELNEFVKFIPPSLVELPTKRPKYRLGTTAVRIVTMSIIVLAILFIVWKISGGISHAFRHL